VSWVPPASKLLWQLAPVTTSDRETQARLNLAASDDSLRDDALIFLDAHKNEEGIELSKVESFTKSLRSKIDRRVMPFLCIVYTMNCIDKVLLNVSSQLPQ
jgi:hypothetical protein